MTFFLFKFNDGTIINIPENQLKKIAQPAAFPKQQKKISFNLSECVLGVKKF